MGRGNILPTKGLIYKTLSLINLFLTKSGGDKGTQGSINTINTFSGTLTEKTLIKTQYQTGLNRVFNYLSHTKYIKV